MWEDKFIQPNKSNSDSKTLTPSMTQCTK